VITVVYYALVNIDEHQVRAASDASNAKWFRLDALPALAFDHDMILRAACDRLHSETKSASPADLTA
jgi:8-oxo-dGTP diphosphatase